MSLAKVSNNGQKIVINRPKLMPVPYKILDVYNSFLCVDPNERMSELVGFFHNFKFSCF